MKTNCKVSAENPKEMNIKTLIISLINILRGRYADGRKIGEKK